MTAKPLARLTFKHLTLCLAAINGGRFTFNPKKYIVWEYNTCRVTQYNRLGHDNQRLAIALISIIVSLRPELACALCLICF